MHFHPQPRISSPSHIFRPPAMHLDPSATHFEPQQCIFTLIHAPATYFDPHLCVLTPQPRLLSPPMTSFDPETVCFNRSPTRFDHPGLFRHRNARTSNRTCVSSFILILILCYSTRTRFLCLFYFILVYST
jgi:hypothetical protein